MKIKNIVLIALALAAFSVGLIHNVAFSKGFEIAPG